MAGILMMTAIAGAENCAAVLSKQLQMEVETVASRKEALVALRRRDYLLVVIDESMIDAEDSGSDALFKHRGLVVPLEINFAISGTGRLLRAVRAALSRPAREREVAAQAAGLRDAERAARERSRPAASRLAGSGRTGDSCSTGRRAHNRG